MHVHVLGISGTFMSALALLAKELGFKVTGSDANCYPPVSGLLEDKNIPWVEGYTDCQDALAADYVIVGNAMKRGMPVLEAVMNAGKNHCSGPAWLAEHVLKNRRVLAIAGTHGKTTTTSMLAYILQEAGFDPGFLIGGVATVFNTSARLGSGDWFVIEADEYDTAFFDKRPKFMHYQPEVAVLNNLEFDHADIYPNLEAIQQQFHYYLKTIPSKGLVLKPRDDTALNKVIEQGVFSRMENMALNGHAEWRAEILNEPASHFNVWYLNEMIAEVNWPLIGRFNVENGLAALAASFQAGVDPKIAAGALNHFKPVKRRLEKIYEQNGIAVYDDFAHHPTAIAKTIEALKQSKRHERIIAVLEFASYTMRSGVHSEHMVSALSDADVVIVLSPDMFELDSLRQKRTLPCHILPDIAAILSQLTEISRQGDGILIMSNRGFGQLHQQLKTCLESRVEPVSG